MPIISIFYGIIVSLYFMDKKRHNRPHVHVRYQNDEAVVSIPDSVERRRGVYGDWAPTASSPSQGLGDEG